MSFVKKAVKKVFKGVKKVVKSKAFKIAAIAGLTLFTAGVAAGGFGAFAGLGSNFTLGGFFTAVGQTIAAGGAKLASMVGLKGLSGSLAKFGGQTAVNAGLIGGSSALTPAFWGS